MACLRATLLMSGKGRRPALPSAIVINNKLLLQLHYLRIEGKKTMKEAEKWFERLFPESAYPLTRLWSRVGRIVEKANHLNGEALCAYMNEIIDLEFISESLQAVGVTRALDGALFKQTELTNDIVLDLGKFMQGEGFSYSEILEKLSLLSCSQVTCTADQLRKRMQAADKTKKKLVSNAKREPEALNSWLRAPFFHSANVATNASSSPCNESASTSFSLPSASLASTKTSFAPPAASTPEKDDDSCTYLHSQNMQYIRKLQQSLNESKEREQNLSTQLQAVKELYQSCQSSLSNLQSNHSILQDKLKAALDQTKSLNQEKSDLEAALKEVKASQLYRRCKRLEKERDDLQVTTSELNDLKERFEELKKEKINLQKYLSIARRRRDQYKAAANRIDDDTVNLLLRDSAPEISLRDGNRFSDALRKTVIALQSRCNVSPSQCSKCIQAVAQELFGINWTLKDLPSEQTLRDIADEAHVLSKVLTAERLQQSKFVLHLDGTSRDKKKIVGHQVTLDNGDTLSLGYTDVATEDAATLLDVTISILRELGEIYDPDHQETIFKEILSKLQCTMTDRASVMKKFCKELNDTCHSTLSNNEELTFLHCNAHFLLGLSSGCDGALKTVEADINFKLGRDADTKFSRFKSTENASSRFVRTACAILGPRGDQKSGCRVEWLAFCEERDISSKLPSYRSNRFNCFFEGAARLIQNLPTIREFLSGHGFARPKGFYTGSILLAFLLWKPMPISTSLILKHCKVWNSVGIIRQYVSDDENTIDVEFHDSSTHHALHIDNKNDFVMADLSSKAVLLASHSLHDTPR
ncbi:WD repeat and hmg-box DNA-binding protein 1 [Plakobranchus ocellatus]|uniref:WD repeat and hmg-box DNA-binding protein 1 n=1 Tax=Plakobranchus ocellatus TaxID=259542 RepID=A0AAV4CRP1_9GAST|nr:WD repeat and hmg-box DNA-binding protein 1 [Plakobranchus ocellatus]